MGAFHIGLVTGLPYSTKWALLPAILVIYLFITAIRYAFLHPLAKVPGPKLYAITQIPYLYHVAQGTWNHKLSQLHDQYGPVVRFAPKDVSFITADAVKTIYSTSFEKDLRIYRQGHPVKDVVTAGREDHKRMRRHLSYAFSTKALRSQDATIYHYVDKFISGLSQRAGTDVDMVAWFNFVTFDLMSHLALGQPFGCLDTGEYHPWITLILTSLKAFSFIIVLSRLGLLWVVRLLPVKHSKSLETHLRFVEDTATARFNTGDIESSDFMSYLLLYSGEGMSNAEIIENASLLITAGSETTATLLSGTIYYLLTNPDKYKILVNEVRSTFIYEDDITLACIDQLKYLQAVLNEGLRLYPPSPTGLPRLAPVGGRLIEGYWIPENTSVSMPHQSAYISAFNFKDPHEFIPERWLGDTKYAKDNRDVVHPFSTGSRDCIGKSFAYTEMRILLTRLLWKFDLILLSGSKDWITQKVYFLHEKPEIQCQQAVVKFEVAKFEGRPIAVPSRRHKDLGVCFLGGTEEEQAAVDVQHRISLISADNGIHSLDSSLNGSRIVIAFEFNETLQIFGQITTELSWVTTRSPDPQSFTKCSPG
ncbi:hypothetical protein HG530_012559 [Fusarium avenaceum]|nr:hypothetical protein HG530_012559 [Fusarium avenaceum]